MTKSPNSATTSRHLVGIQIFGEFCYSRSTDERVEYCATLPNENKERREIEREKGNNKR